MSPEVQCLAHVIVYVAKVNKLDILLLKISDNEIFFSTADNRYLDSLKLIEMINAFVKNISAFHQILPKNVYMSYEPYYFEKKQIFYYDGLNLQYTEKINKELLLEICSSLILKKKSRTIKFTFKLPP